MTATHTAPRPPAGSTARPGTGLYRLKPWYAERLRPVLAWLDRRDVSPDLVSAAGVGAAVIGGLVLAFAPYGPVSALAVLLAAAVRLGAANLDGNLARLRPPRPSGAVTNELGDRLGDLALLAGVAVHVPGPLGWGLLLAACAPSWVSLARAAAGGTRRNGGPVGKTERAALAVAAAATGWWSPLTVVIAAGSALTALTRLVGAYRELDGTVSRAGAVRS